MGIFSKAFSCSHNSIKNKSLFSIKTTLALGIVCFSTLFIAHSATPNTPPKAVKSDAPDSVIFYYNKIYTIDRLINFDRIVVEPSLISQRQLSAIRKADSLVFAYLSIGELGTQNIRPEQSNAVLAKNDAWQSTVMDLTSATWQDYLNEQASELIDRGFDGIFLDTLDSYQLASLNEQASASQKAALVRIIDKIQGLQAQPKLILNRGFEIVEALNTKPYAVLVESMNHRYSHDTKLYEAVSEADTLWLTNKLAPIAQQDIEIMVIDYLPSSNRSKQIEAAKHIIKQGYTPYVSDGLLYEVGVSSILPVNRRVLGFYNGKIHGLLDSECHRLLAMPLEYLGYISECRDIYDFDFDSFNVNQYAALTFWIKTNDYNLVPQINELIESAYNKIPMLFMSTFPTNARIQRLLGMTRGEDISSSMQQITGAEWTNDFKKAQFNIFESADRWLPLNDSIKQHVIFESDDGKQSTYVFSASWGGAALEPFPLKILASQMKTVWMLAPFKLLESTLKLPPIPVPDITTESGRRILTSHVDGDGFPSKSSFPGNPYTAEVLRDKVFSRYKIPHTVSVIQGEIYSGGLFPKQSKALEEIARSIFIIENVEIASHTYSHPFFWREYTSTEKLYGDHLPIKDYEIDFEKEILGSLNYINEKLAPKGKTAQVLLWSGSANPSEETLQISESNNILNVNGGNTYVVDGNYDLSQVFPHVVWYPSAVQVYAPTINENLYTNLWTEHYDGYARVIESYKLLESPRRLKPISIYYHMYSGRFPASLKALDDVYQWTMAQSVNPMYLSEFASRARTLYDTGIAQTLNGAWQISSTGIKSVRLPNSLAYPSTEQLAGWIQAHDGKYITLSAAKSEFITSSTPYDDTFLISSNGQIKKWQHINNNKVEWEILTHVPLELDVQIASEIVLDSCQISASKTVDFTRSPSNILNITSKQTGIIAGTIDCNVLVDQGQKISL